MLLYFCGNIVFLRKTVLVMKRMYLILAALAALIFSVSCEMMEDVSPDNYMDTFELEPYESWEGTVARVVASNPISRNEVMDVLVGHGWENTAVYKLDFDKNIIETVADDHPACFFVKNEDTHIQYGLMEERYEVHSLSYDESDNCIGLSACWYVGGNRDGKVVHISENTMICVTSKGADYKKSPLIYMTVFQKVTKKTLKDWQEKCPKPGLWI